MFTADEIRDHIPKYLTPSEQSELIGQLRDFENRDYYTIRYANDILQGDGWSGVEIVSFVDAKRDKIKGILLSNSCDIDSSNKHDFPPRIVFAPLIRFDAYVARLSALTMAREQIESKLEAIRKQRISSLFFLPRGGKLDSDHMAVLDDLHTIPLRSFEGEVQKLKLFTLNQMGFYLFLLKLSMHFCRFQEGISRS